MEDFLGTGASNDAERCGERWLTVIVGLSQVVPHTLVHKVLIPAIYNGAQKE